MASKLQEAIDSIKAGDKKGGQQLLAQVLKADPQNEMAWLWMSKAVDNDNQRRQCFEYVLKLNPNNETAQRGIEILQAKQKSQVERIQSSRVEPQELPDSSLSHPESVEKPSLLKSSKLQPETTKKCPYCAEIIKAEATVCRFCGTSLIEVKDRSSKVIAKKPKSKKKSWVPFLLIAILFACGICYIIGQLQNFSSTVNQSSTTAPSSTSVAVEEAKGILPGVQPSDIKVSLEERGFACTSINKATTADYYYWDCKLNTVDYDVEVNIYGSSPLTVDYISTVAVNYAGSDGLLVKILGYIATVPYNGAEPEQARNWMEANFYDEATHESSFGGVEYALYGPPNARSLTIGVFKW